MTAYTDLDAIFNPRSIAVVGVSAPLPGMPPGGGLFYFMCQLKAGFKGPVYAVNPKGGEFQGTKIYESVKDVPGPVDYVICCTGARFTPQVVADCAAKGVKAIHFFTAGFSETGTEEGARLEQEICRIASEGNVRIIGPNGMGLYYPENGITFRTEFPRDGGRVGFLSQSGGNTFSLVLLAYERGIRFSKVVSYGNACDIDECDMLEYFADDGETDIILGYIEGVKDGRRFKRVLQKAARTKPVIILKGGYSEAGARAVSSHTGALAGSAMIWDELLRHTGAIAANSLEEMLDLVLTFQYLPVPHGRRIGTVGVGGGAGVLATDTYSSIGLDLPSFPPEFQQKLGSFVPSLAGKSFNNPVDITGAQGGTPMYNVGKALVDSEQIDALVFHLAFTVFPGDSSPSEEGILDYVDQAIRIRRETSKPVAVAIYDMYNPALWQVAHKCQAKLHEAGIPAYLSIPATAQALSQYITYHQRRNGHNH